MLDKSLYQYGTTSLLAMLEHLLALLHSQNCISFLNDQRGSG